MQGCDSCAADEDLWLCGQRGAVEGANTALLHGHGMGQGVCGGGVCSDRAGTVSSSQSLVSGQGFSAAGAGAAGIQIVLASSWALQ